MPTRCVDHTVVSYGGRRDCFGPAHLTVDLMRYQPGGFDQSLARVQQHGSSPLDSHPTIPCPSGQRLTVHSRTHSTVEGAASSPATTVTCP